MQDYRNRLTANMNASSAVMNPSVNQVPAQNVPMAN